MSRSRIAALTAATTLFVSGAFAGNASALFHDIRISEIHTEPLTVNDFIELQMFSPGQNMLMNHYLYVYDGTGGIVGDTPVPTNAGSGENQRTFTIGNNPTRDYNYGGAVVNPGAGAVCWNESAAGVGGLDCVGWGTFVTGTGAAMTSPKGSNAPAITEGQSLQRRINRGCATLLEAIDDTNDGAADFTVGAPTPRNNNVAPTEKPCTTPGKKKKCKKAKKKGKKGYASAAAKKKCKKKKKK